MDKHVIVSLIFLCLAVNSEILMFCLVASSCPVSENPYDGNNDYHILGATGFSVIALLILGFGGFVRLVGVIFLRRSGFKLIYWVLNVFITICSIATLLVVAVTFKYFIADHDDGGPCQQKAGFIFIYVAMGFEGCVFLSGVVALCLHFWDQRREDLLEHQEGEGIYATEEEELVVVVGVIAVIQRWFLVFQS